MTVNFTKKQFAHPTILRRRCFGKHHAGLERGRSALATASPFFFWRIRNKKLNGETFFNKWRCCIKSRSFLFFPQSNIRWQWICVKENGAIIISLPSPHSKQQLAQKPSMVKQNAESDLLLNSWFIYFSIIKHPNLNKSDSLIN